MNETIPAHKGRMRWPLIILCMLGGHVAAMMLAVQIARGNSGHAALPEYYERATRWDERQRSSRASVELGWNVTITAATLRSSDGSRALRVVAADQDGRPIEGAAVTVRIWHHAIGTLHTLGAKAQEQPGVYLVNAPMDRAGTWSCDVEVTRTDVVWHDERELEVAPLIAAAGASDRSAH